MNYRFTVFLYILLALLSAVSCTKDKPAGQEKVKEAPAEAPGTAATDVREGAKIFGLNCMVCHGEGGRGDICPDLTDNEWKYGSSDEQIFESISKGRPGGMPDWGNNLSDKQISDLISYIRSIGEK